LPLYLNLSSMLYIYHMEDPNASLFFPRSPRGYIPRIDIENA